MCPITIETVTAKPITPIVTPVIAPVIAPIVVPVVTPSSDPLLDLSGNLPIANQKLDITTNQYVRTNNKVEFLNLTRAEYKKYWPNLKKPKIVNIINPSLNKTFNIKNIITTANFNVENAKAIANFGNSCYFGVSMHFLFIMYSVREAIIKNNYLESYVTGNTKLAFDNIRRLLTEMNKKPKNIPIPNTFFSKQEYLNIKKQIMNTNSTTEEDAEEFLTRAFGYFLPKVRDLFTYKINEIIYHGNTGSVISTRSDSGFIFEVGLDVIKSNPNISLEKAMALSYEYLFFREGSDAIQENGGDYVFGYMFREITSFPTYLIVRLNMIDPTSAKKNDHNIKINTTISVSNSIGTAARRYFMTGIIVHIGDRIDTGHYTALMYDNFNGNNFEYIHYSDDQSTIALPMPVDSEFIPEKFYRNRNNETAYLILYTDITQLR